MTDGSEQVPLQPEIITRPFSAKDGSRDSVFEEERMHLMPLPTERYEMREWRSPKVAPDYHVKWIAIHFTWNGQLGQMRSP